MIFDAAVLHVFNGARNMCSISNQRDSVEDKHERELIAPLLAKEE
jgi:hypothetical protein